MHTFSCAVQQVDVNGVPLQFQIDPTDHAVCRLVVGEVILTFQRNGMLTGITEPTEEEPDDGVSEGHEEPLPVGDEQSAGDEHPSARDAEPLTVRG